MANDGSGVHNKEKSYHANQAGLNKRNRPEVRRDVEEPRIDPLKRSVGPQQGLNTTLTASPSTNTHAPSNAVPIIQRHPRSERRIKVVGVVKRTHVRSNTRASLPSSACAASQYADIAHKGEGRVEGPVTDRTDRAFQELKGLVGKSCRIT